MNKCETAMRESVSNLLDEIERVVMQCGAKVYITLEEKNMNRKELIELIKQDLMLKSTMSSQDLELVAKYIMGLIENGQDLSLDINPDIVDKIQENMDKGPF